MQKHVDALLKVVERSHEDSSSGDDKKAKLTKLSDSDDVEAYLTTFKWMMAAFEVDNMRWVFKLAPQLTG